MAVEELDDLFPSVDEPAAKRPKSAEEKGKGVSVAGGVDVARPRVTASKKKSSVLVARRKKAVSFLMPSRVASLEVQKTAMGGLFVLGGSAANKNHKS